MIKIFCDICEDEVPVETERVMLTARYYKYPAVLVKALETPKITAPQPAEATIFFCKPCATKQLKMTL